MSGSNLRVENTLPAWFAWEFMTWITRILIRGDLGDGLFIRRGKWKIKLSYYDILKIVAEKFDLDYIFNRENPAFVEDKVSWPSSE